ncbi:MAG: hypothetical protein ACREOK_07835 [Gemmatimonadaceae bacterium]
MTEPTNAGNNPPLPALSKRRGLSARGERILNMAGPIFVALFVVAWIWSIRIANAAEARGEVVARPASRVTAALSRDAPTASYVKDAALEALARRARGTSGQLRAAFVLPNEVNQALNAVNNFTQIVLTPFNQKQRGRVGGYMLGSWPGESTRGRVGPSRAPADRYANPRGFIQVTQQNQNMNISQHFQLRHFLTKNQPNVWPKYLALETRLIDKLELVLADLRSRGVNTAGVTVMSGFRTPSYNAGGGNTGGRADLSRHMYGDAADVYIDNDRDGNMDDLNGDGRVNIGDARFMEDAVNRVERAHPELIGGAGVYVACCGHGPFIHIDTRGYRARWTGSSGG